MSNRYGRLQNEGAGVESSMTTRVGTSREFWKEFGKGGEGLGVGLGEFNEV